VAKRRFRTGWLHKAGTIRSTRGET